MTAGIYKTFHNRRAKVPADAQTPAYIMTNWSHYINGKEVRLQRAHEQGAAEYKVQYCDMVCYNVWM